MLLILLAGLVALGPKECVMIIPPFRLEGSGIQHISSVCQIPKILAAVSTRQGGEFAVKILNAGKEARMISQKLAMIGVQFFEGGKITWDTQVAEVKPINLVKPKEDHIVNSINVEKLKQEYLKVFEKEVIHGNNAFLHIAKVCH